MTATLTLDEAGQINLPSAARRVFGAAPGVRVRAEVTADRIEIVKETQAPENLQHRTVLPTQAEPTTEHRAWLGRLDKLRHSVGTGKEGSSAEDILNDLRSERG